MTVNVGEILEELTKERKERPGASATTLNLVAFVEDASRVEWIRERMNTIARKHPSRTLVLDATHPESSHAVRSGAKEVNDTLLTQNEEIALGVQDVGADELGSIVRALVVPQVQTVLAWAGSHIAGDARFTELVSIANNLVLDSSRIDSSTGTLRELAEWMSVGNHPAVRDLAYMRLEPWQDMIAQFFDETDLADELPLISRFSVTAGSDAEAYYLTGWLASRLQWQACGAKEFCNPQGQTIRVNFKREGDPRRVRRIELRSEHSTFTAALQEEPIVCLTVTGKKARPQRCAPLHDVDVVSLIEKAILIPDGGELFRESMEMARALLEQKGAQS